MYSWSRNYDTKINWLICDVIQDFVSLQKLSHNIQDYSHNGSTSGGWLHIGTECGDDLFIQTEINLLTKMRDWFLTEVDSVSPWRQWSVAATRRKSFNQIDGQVENLRRNCSYFVMMIRCWKQMPVLQTNWWTGREQKEKLFLLCDDDLLLLMDLCPSRTFTDRWRTEGETVYTLQWWSVAADGSPSFKDIYGQVENRRSHWFYFGLMICFRNRMPLRIRRSTL